MYRSSKNKSFQRSIRSIFQRHSDNLIFFTHFKNIMSAFKTVHRRVLTSLSAALVLSVFLSACGGGGGGGGGSTPTPTPTPTPNTAPTLTIPNSNLTFSEDFATAQLVATATNATGITVNQSNTGVVNVTASTTGVSVQSILNAHGRTILTITATNGSLSSTAQVVVTVTPVNDTPTLTVSTNNISFSAGFSTITINTTASDVEDAVLTFAVDESPSGVVRVSPSANAIILNAIAGVSGQTTLTVSVVDTSGKRATQIISVRVVPLPNVAPVLTVSTNRISVEEDFRTSVVIRTTATDAVGDTITLSVSSSSRLVDAVVSAPIRGTNALTNNITLTPIANLNGTATLTVQASDANGQSQSTEIVVVVTAVGDTPTLTIATASLTAVEDFLGATTVATAIDTDNDPLTFDVLQSNTGVITVTTSASGVQVEIIANANGLTTLTITVSDGSLSSTAQVVFTVTPVNDTPTISVSTTALTLVEDFDSIVSIPVNRADIDSNTLTLSVAESTTGVVTVTTSAAGVQLERIANVNGVTTLTITVSDDSLSSSAQVVVTVTPVNDTPTLSVSTNSISTLGGFRPITINTTASDNEDDVITFTLTQSATGVVRITTSANAIVLNAIPGVAGQTTLTVRTTDSDGLTAIQTIAVNVSIISSVIPVLMVSTDLIRAQEDFRAAIVIQTTATDADGDTITLSVSPSMRLVSVVVSTPINSLSPLSNSITLSAIANLNGTATLTVQASDAGGQSTITEIVVVVTAVEDAPILTIPTATLTVAEDFAGAITIATAMDDDGDSLSFSVVESTTGVVTVTTSVTDVRVSSRADANGATTLTMTVSDGTLSSTAQVVVTVTPVNDPPTLSVSTTAVTLNEDFATIASITLTIGDLDNDTLTLTVTESNTGVVTVTTSATTVQLANIAHANGATTLTIAISDGSLSSTAQVGVTVLAVNDTPTLSVSTNNVSVNFDFSTITIHTTASDVEEGALTFTVQASSSGVVSITTSANAITLNAISGVSGQTTLTVRTVDNSNAAVVQTIVVNVLPPPNVPPVLIVSANRISVLEDFRDSVVIRTTATDANGDTITLSVSSSSRLVDAAISPLSNGISTITLTAIENANGTTTLNVQASANGQSVSTDIIVIVVPVNDTPTLSVSTNNITTLGGFSPITINTTASDVEDSNLSFTVIESSTGVY